MVAMMAGPPSENVFRILYKMPGFPPQRLTFTATDLVALLKMLRRTESISVDTAEMLIIHQDLPDGSVCEVMDHDLTQGPRPSKGTNVVPIRPLPLPKEGDKQEEVIQAVHKVLVKASAENKKLRPLQGKVTVGFGLHAYVARSGNEYES